MGQALTAQMHQTGSLCKQGGRRGTAPSQQGQAGTLFLQGGLAAGQQFSPCSWSRVRAKQSIPTHAPGVRHLGALMAPVLPLHRAIPSRGEARLPPPRRDTVKPEHGGKLQLRRQTSAGQGLPQAGSSHTASPFFWWLVGWDPPHYGLHHPARLPFSYRHSPGSSTA